MNRRLLPPEKKAAKALASAIRRRLDATSSGNLPQAAKRALRMRITVAQDTLRVLFTVPAGRAHRLGARELKRGCPASQVYRSAPRSKSQGCRSKSQGCPAAREDKMPMVAKPLSLQGVNIPDPRKTYTLAEAVEAAVAREKALKQRREMTISVPTAVTTTAPRVPGPAPGARAAEPRAAGFALRAVPQAHRRARGHRGLPAPAARIAGRRVPPARGSGG